MKKYRIWNKKDQILTPTGKVFSAEQWIEQYPIAGLHNITVLCAAGEINGAFFGTLGQMVDQYASMGCDFSNCTTDQEKLDVIEAFDDAREERDREASSTYVSNQELTATALASIAASLEYQNMLTLDDMEEV